MATRPSVKRKGLAGHNWRAKWIRNDPHEPTETGTTEKRGKSPGQRKACWHRHALDVADRSATPGNQKGSDTATPPAWRIRQPRKEGQTRTDEPEKTRRGGLEEAVAPHAATAVWEAPRRIRGGVSATPKRHTERRPESAPPTWRLQRRWVRHVAYGPSRYATLPGVAFLEATATNTWRLHQRAKSRLVRHARNTWRTVRHVARETATPVSVACVDHKRAATRGCRKPD